MFTIKLGNEKLSKEDTKNILKDLIDKPSKKETEKILKFLNDYQDILKIKNDNL